MSYECLETFGRAIIDYFTQHFEQGEEFRLCVTEHVLKECCIVSNLQKNDVIKELQKLKRYIYYGDYVKIAVAAYQVFIAEDIAFEKENAYYNKIREAYPKYKDYSNAYLMNEYVNEMDLLWNDVHKIFKTQNLNLVIPADKTGKDRYVQYPKSQRLLPKKDLELYYEKAQELFSEFEINSIDDFKQRIKKYTLGDGIFKLSEKEKELAWYQIFLYYNYWIENPPPEKERIYLSQEKHHLSNITIKENSNNEIKILKDGKDFFDFSKISINNSVKKYFLYDENYDDWIFTSKKIHNTVNEIFICVKQNSNQLDELKNCEKISKGEYDFIKITENIKEISIKLGLPYSEKELFTFYGGLKSNAYNNSWFSFALPILKVDENYKSVFIDSKEIFLNNKEIDLKTLSLEKGPHSIKFYKTTPMKFIVSNDSKIIKPFSIGWHITNKNILLSTEQINTDIAGFVEKGNITNHKARPFLAHKIKLENRFSKKYIFNSRSLI